MTKTKWNNKIHLFSLFFLIILSIISIGLGKYPISLSDILSVFGQRIFFSQKNYPLILETVLFDIRFPRIVGAILVGASLALSGAIFQGIFKNPLVSPDILGVAHGAGFGAALAIYFSMNMFYVQLFAFIFGLIAVFLSYFVSQRIKRQSTLSLVLSGIAIGAFFYALISLIKTIADPYSQLPSIVFWLMGSLSSISNSDIRIVLFPILSSFIILLMLRWKINLLTIDDGEAKSMGVDTANLRLVIIVCCTMITASSVCIGGVISWVGLVIPHICRLLVGPDYKDLVISSAIIGSAYLLFIDNLARNITNVEIPLGILTSVVGVPIFIFLFIRRGQTWV